MLLLKLTELALLVFFLVDGTKMRISLYLLVCRLAVLVKQEDALAYEILCQLESINHRKFVWCKVANQEGIISF